METWSHKGILNSGGLHEPLSTAALFSQKSGASSSSSGS